MFGRGFDSRRLHLVIQKRTKPAHNLGWLFLSTKSKACLRILGEEKDGKRAADTGFVRLKNPLHMGPARENFSCEVSIRVPKAREGFHSRPLYVSSFHGQHLTHVPRFSGRYGTIFSLGRRATTGRARDCFLHAGPIPLDAPYRQKQHRPSRFPHQRLEQRKVRTRVASPTPD